MTLIEDQRARLEAVLGSVEPVEGTSADLDDEIDAAMALEVERSRIPSNPSGTGTTMTSQHFRIENLADHLDLAETIARWHWDEWGQRDQTRSPESWAEGMRGRANRERIPTTFVALDLATGDLLGSVTLVDNDMASHPELSPWLAGVYTRLDQRKRGVASALVRHAVQAAATLGVTRLYLHTETARDLYQHLGWQPIGEESYADELSTIMSIETDIAS